MTESIFIRVQRLLSAGADTSIAAAERASGTSLMREAIRQIDRAADEIRAEHETASADRLRAQRQQQVLRERLATLDEQARFALSKGGEDLAEAAVSRQIEHESELKRRLAALRVKQDAPAAIVRRRPTPRTKAD